MKCTHPPPIRAARLLASVLCLLISAPPAQAQQFNAGSDGSTYQKTDSAFKLFWDSTNDVVQLLAAVSGTAGNPITWTTGLQMNTAGQSLFQVGNDAGACTAAKLGRIRYNGTSTWEYCNNATTWTALGPAIAGANTQIIFNDGGSAYGGDAGLTYDKTNDILSVTGAVVLGGVSGNAPVNIAIGDLSGVALASPANGECLVHNGTNWVDGACGGGSGALNDLSDAVKDTTAHNMILGTELSMFAGAENNLFIGESAGAAGTHSAADNNIAIGYQALDALTTGDENVALGYAALGANTTGYNNTAIGAQTLINNSDGIENTALGAYALNANLDGGQNVALGAGTLEFNTSGGSNVAIGYTALLNSSTSGQVAVGHEALMTPATATGNTAVGYQALKLNQNGGLSNTALGYQALDANTTGDYGIAIGHSALGANTTSSGQVAIGFEALSTAATATGNTAVGYQALKVNANGGIDNTAIGHQALDANTTGDYNAALGSGALGANQDAGNNVALGYYALNLNSSGWDNIAIGSNALYANTGGSHHVAIGSYALDSVTTDGERNIAIGYYAGENITTGDNNIIIGYDVDAPSATGNSQMSIGNLIFATGGFGTGTAVGAGNVGIATNNPQSTLHVPDGKYLQAEDNNAGAPPAGDCDADAERGRLSIDTTNNRLYVCNGAARGWDYVALTD